jgi:superfamily I DNA/RNA helicase
MTHTPTIEQQAIIDAASKTKASLLVNALAGAAKTTTLVMAAHKMPLVPTLCVAFNKRIADEMAKRMPSHIQCATMNAIGHRVWGQYTSKRLAVDSGKGYNILSDMKTRLPKGSAESEQMGENFATILRAYRHLKSAGYVPESYASMTRTGKGGLEFDGPEFRESLASGIDADVDDQMMAWLDNMLMTSIAEAFQGKIDFDDQIYMTALFGGTFPRFPIVMVDEAQDLSPLNHLMLEQMVAPDGRLIAVGDPNQAIYGFRGAHADSMGYLKNKFSMTELTLSTSFRCPIKVIERAQALRVPHMRWPEWAKEGKVERLSQWSFSDVPDGAAVICRNNAPLFDCALRFIRAGRSVKIVGSDIGAALVKLMRKLGPDTTPQAEFKAKIREWEEDQLSKVVEARKASITDRAACLLVFADAGNNLGESVMFAEMLFSASGKIDFLSGHKAKGLEWETVFHLDPWRVPSKWAKAAADAGDPSKLEQEYNLRYVIETRPQEHLYLVNLEDLV